MSKETKASIIAAVCTSAVVSVAGGMIGTYVAFRLIEQRMSQVENALVIHDKLIDDNRERAEDAARDLARLVGEVNSSVQYIRGRIENMPAPTQEHR